MLRHLASQEKGFTLMELLIAVAIVAVLAGVGIPLYMGLQGKAKAAEATANLDGIGTCLESYKLTNGVYRACYASPAAANAVNQNQTAWGSVVDPLSSEAGFDLIGFDTNKGVRFSYAVGIGADPLTYISGAIGDTDGDGNYVLYTAHESVGPSIVVAGELNLADLQAAEAFDNAVEVVDTSVTD
jgi:prepilin-type N-terminal cleavage/methylation domain-containing protein